MAIQTIRPFLWFGTHTEAAAELYVSIFENSHIVNRMGSGDDGVPMGVELELDGLRGAPSRCGWLKDRF